MVTQKCFISSSPEERRALIAQAAAASAGLDVTLNCTSDNVPLGDWYLYLALSEMGPSLSAVAAGTAYTLTTGSANLDFGTTDPVITFPTDGTYLITADVQAAFSGATYAALQSMSFKLYRTNNTPGQIGFDRSAVIPIMTTYTGTGPSVFLQFLYTATAGDVVTIQGLLSALPSAGSVTVARAQITAKPTTVPQP